MTFSESCLLHLVIGHSLEYTAMKTIVYKTCKRAIIEMRPKQPNMETPPAATKENSCLNLRYIVLLDIKGCIMPLCEVTDVHGRYMLKQLNVKST